LDLLAPSNLDLGAIICLADREWKQVESISGQNRIARCEVIEPYPSIANPDDTWRHVIGDVGLLAILAFREAGSAHVMARRAQACGT